MNPAPIDIRSALVIDDDPFYASLMEEMLRSMGVTEVSSVNRARDALDLLGSLDFDLLVSDVFMPDMDGIEFVEAIGQTAYKGKLILMSGEDPSILQITQMISEQQHLQLLAALIKPVTPDMLANALRR